MGGYNVITQLKITGTILSKGDAGDESKNICTGATVLPCESCAPGLGSGHFEKVSVAFVGRQESGRGGGKEEKTCIRTGWKNHC